ncbi:MAG: DUF4358 domain-containing protein [Eubacteriales bacterium]|nr:DUF4358 domain-containing protein [Eubacteriales bacterium]
MKKNVSLFLLAALLVFVCTACGSKKNDKDITVDISKLCEDLKGTITSGDLAEDSSNLIASTYFFDMSKIEESAAALNSGASACEVAVVKCSDSSYVKDVEELFKTRVKNQSELFAAYNATEVAKLESAVLKSAGNYVVFCVTDDTAKAEEIIKNAGF